MSYIFTTIEPFIKHENVLRTINEVKYEYEKELIEEKKTINNQMKVIYILGSLSTHYQNIFNVAYKETSDSLKAISQNNSDTFNNQLLNIYRRLNSLHNPDDLDKEPSLSLENTPENQKYLYQTNNIIRFFLQKLFVKPMMLDIEKNYLYELIYLNLLPIHITNIIEKISSDNIVFYESDCESMRENFHFTFSNKTNCVYYFSYYNYTDIYSYNSNLDKILTQFKQSVNNTCSIVDDLNLKIDYLNRIRSVLLEVITLFRKVDSLKLNKPYEIPYHVRQTTLMIFKQLTADLFDDDEIDKVKTYFFNFQDLQFQIANQALSFTESKIKMLSFVIKHRLNIPEVHASSNKTNLIEKLKIKLTVPQLGFFLRMIIEEKGILDVNNKAAFFRKVTTAISALKQNDISPISLNDKAKNPTEKTIEFWIEKLTHLLQFAKQLRDKMAR